MGAEALSETTNSPSCYTSRGKPPNLCHHLLLLLQVTLVSVLAVSNMCASGLHVSELSTEFLELSGLVCCATGYHHLIQSCLESTEKTQLCMEAWMWVCASSQQSCGRLAFTSGERSLVVRTCSHHALSWATSPQAPFPQCMGTLQPSTGFNSDTIILHLEALVCGPGLQIYLPALSFYFFPGDKGTRIDKKVAKMKSYTYKRVPLYLQSSTAYL